MCVWLIKQIAKKPISYNFTMNGEPDLNVLFHI